MALSPAESDLLRQVAAILKREALAASDLPTKISIHGFGAFKIGMSKARTGRNPKTGGSVPIPAKRTFKFSVSKTWLNPDETPAATPASSAS